MVSAIPPRGPMAGALAMLLIVQSLQASSIIGRSVYGEWDGKGGDKITTLLNLLTLGAAVCLLLPALRGAMALRGTWFALGFAAFLAASAAWSVDPATTLRRASLYITSVMGAVALAARFSPTVYFRMTARVAACAALLSLLLAIAAPASAWASGGELRGVFSHKNMLGQAMALGVLAALHCWRTGAERPSRAACCVLLCLAAAALSHSTTSLVIALLCIVVHVAMSFWQRGGWRRHAVAAVGAFGVAACLAIFFVPDIALAALGKDPTLTGRTELWQYVETDIAQHPLLGWGYGAFWAPSNPAAVEISAALHWFVPQAHNGALEMLLQAGGLGLAAIALLWGRGVALAWRCRGQNAVLALSAMLVSGMIVLLGSTESVLVEPFQPTTMCFFAAALLCEAARPVPVRAGI